MRIPITRLIAALALAAGVAAASIGADASRWGAGYMPNVPVKTHDGRTLNFYDDVIKGKVVVVSFIYTTCRDICPLVTARLEQVREKLGEAVVGREVFFVSISIDPVRDTPERLKEHAEAFGAGPDWLFLTGEKADIDLIRHKLGDRSRKLTEHRNEIMLGNDRTGEWARDSAFGDLNTLASTIRSMDPVYRHARNGPVGLRDAIAAAPPTTAASVDAPGQSLYIKMCAACHTIGGGDRVGPDLLGLPERRQRDWIVSYITAPEAARARKDPIAMALREKYRAVRMPNLDLSEDDVADVLAYLQARTAVVNGTPPPASQAATGAGLPRHH